MYRKKVIDCFMCYFLITAIGLCAWSAFHVLHSIGSETDYSVESLRWTMIRAIGNWLGSVFGAIALVVSLFTKC